MESNSGGTGLVEKILADKGYRRACIVGVIAGLGLGVWELMSVNNNERLTCQSLEKDEDPNQQDFDRTISLFVPNGPLIPRTYFYPIIPEKCRSFRDAGAKVFTVVTNCRNRFGIVVTPNQVRAGVEKVLKAE